MARKQDRSDKDLLLRISVDVVVPKNISGNVATKIANEIMDYASSVSVHKELNYTIQESDPGVAFHVHDGVNGCSQCRDNYADRKNVNDPRAEN